MYNVDNKMASFDLNLKDIVSNFINVSDLTHWAIENKCINDPYVLNRLEYLISVENTIKSFHDSKQLLEWSLDNNVFNLPIVRNKIAFLNNLENNDNSPNQTKISCDQCKRHFEGSLSYKKHKCSPKHFCVECKGYFVNIENHSKIHMQNYQPKEVKCRKCHECFPDRKKLYMHSMTVHQIGDKIIYNQFHSM